MPTVAALKLVLPLVLDNLSLFLFVYLGRCVSLATRGTWRAREIYNIAHINWVATHFVEEGKRETIWVKGALQI